MEQPSATKTLEMQILHGEICAAPLRNSGGVTTNCKVHTQQKKRKKKKEKKKEMNYLGQHNEGCLSGNKIKASRGPFLLSSRKSSRTKNLSGFLSIARGSW